MALTPEDVVNKRFQPTKFREGYDQDEVDDFLDEIVVELRRLNQENDELRKKLAEAGSSVPASSAAAPVVEKVPAPVKADKDEAREKAEAEAKAAEANKKKDVQPAAPAAAAPAAPAAVATPSAESAAGLLAMAQQMHDRHVADGQAQKDKIIAEAQIEASSLVNDAQEKSRKILGALEQQRSVLERKVEQLRGFERDYRSRLKAYIEGQLRDLDARGSVATPEVSEAN
ncbi:MULTISPECIES: DivIVA domain-containing protein [Micrococcaceae]|jgi:DivIVA domain-containing protein|uniref:DivIVA domain-containing protein n=1 Tax=Micrococcaceae TaxID=1268 RepID=UPI0006FD47AB|nr:MULTISPECIES: DivIVA domain-containing protein [Micrococcaceae]KRE89984.1 cell division protein [Arthrobacter sp. Soil764]MDQ0664870.1 DivIVA domain-containing protein [Arthrobacter ulcerisalmonis]MDQ0732563.1 DivIVA domain-containing protein [Arthrobacter sp. B1I2]MDQ0826375.1 DivIVA domain-containing protein [Arthrobacter sp. B2I5]MDT0170124.1 DivIVA domain-containing protein [Pseudarthrobacter sp. BRE9]